MPRVTALFMIILLACSGEMGSSAPAATGVPTVDESIPPEGIADRGDDPAVVAIDVGGQAICGGALVAPDVVLTARRCITNAMPEGACPARAMQPASPLAPQSIRILVGDETATAQERARGRDVVTPGDKVCSLDIAFVLLDTSIDEISPLPVRPTGAAKGDRLRTVGFAGSGVAVKKVVRDHLPVLDATAIELEIGETCESTAGGLAMDESTGEIVGVASRPGGRRCAGANSVDIYERADVFLSLIGEALAKSTAPAGSTTGKKKTKKGPIDMGANCAHGADCAAGVCVTDRSKEYCSRTCGPNDRCPAHFRCQKTSGSAWICVEH